MRPCPCWAAPVRAHDGHCCFRHYDEQTNEVTCGHDDDGMRVFYGSQDGA